MPNNSADLFIYSDLTHDEQFKVILKGIIAAYQLMLISCKEIENNENKIRNYLCEHFLQKGDFKKEHFLQPFHFDAESAVIKDGKENGFIDIKVITTETFFEPEDYYTIECKRLDGDYKYKIAKENLLLKKSSLATMYIENGIERFVKGKYPTTLGVNGMLGFIVQTTDIEEGIAIINDLINNRFPQSNTTHLLSKADSIPDFNKTYLSTHLDTNQISFDLYHLMLDFSSIIKGF